MPNPDALLKPGMFAVANIDQGRTAKVMVVPPRAVIEDANTNSYRVFVIDKDNKAPAAGRAAGGARQRRDDRDRVGPQAKTSASRRPTWRTSTTAPT